MQTLPSPSDIPDLSPLLRHAQAQAAQSPSCPTLLRLAAVHILRGEYSEAEAAVQRAEQYPTQPITNQPITNQPITNQPITNQPINQPIAGRFRQIIRYEAYERMPGEINIYITEVTVLKEKAGGVPRKQLEPLPETGDPETDELIRFLNTRLLHWEWRSTRNLLLGARFAPDISGIAVIYQRQLETCKTLFEKGDLFAGIVAADFSRTAGATQQAIDWLTQTHQLAEQNRDALTQALCQLWLGDCLSAPYSQPVLWNFAMQASTAQNGVLPPAVESLEFTRPTPENLDQARQAWEEARALFAQAGAERGLGQILLRQGYLAMLGEQFEETARYARQARDLFEKTGDHLNARLAETHLLMALTAENMIPEALSLAQSIGAWGLQSGNISWAAGLGLLAGRFARHLMLRKGMAETALKAFQVARELHLAAGGRYHAAQHLTDLGEVYKAMGHTEAATVYFEQAADEVESVLQNEWNNFHDELNTAIHTRTGIVMLMSDNFLLGMRRMDADLMDRSIGRMQQACEQIRAAATPEQMAAMPQVGQVFGLYEQMAEQAGVLSPLYRSQSLRDRGDLAGFEQEWQKAHDALPRISPLQQNVLGSAVWGVKRDWQKAAECFRNYIGLGGATGGMLKDMMQFMEQFGEQGKAEIQLQHFRFQTQALSGLVRTKQYAEALTHYDTLRQTYGDQWWQRDEPPWLILSDCGEMMEGLGRFGEALQLFDLGLEQLEHRRRQLSRDELKVALAGSQNTHFLYAYAARAAMKASQPENAFRYAELGKARGLLDLMAENRYQASNNPEAQQITLQLRETDARRSVLTGQLAKERSSQAPDPALLQLLSTEIAEADAQRLRLEQELARYATGATPLRQEMIAWPDGSASPDHNNAPEKRLIETVSAALEPGELLVEYLLAGDDLLVWAVRRDGLAGAEAFKVESWIIKSEISRLRQALTDRQTWETLAQALADRLLTPIATPLRAARKVIFVPHGALHTLPFQVLPFDGRPLGLTRTLSYLPAAGALELLEKAPDLSNAHILAVGNPTGDLPAAAVEARLVARQYGAEALTGAAATEAAVRERLPYANLLHLATHGNLSEDAPMQSSLSLAGGQQLTLHELMGIRLNAALVVLSACDTGRGAHTGGDDVLGLARGLIAGGARSAVVSLWPVDDASTALLMEHFYSRLKTGHPPAPALHLAQVYLSGLAPEQQNAALKNLELSVAGAEVRDWVAKRRKARDIAGFTDETAPETADYRHPYYWAGFVVVGR